MRSQSPGLRKLLPWDYIWAHTVEPCLHTGVVIDNKQKRRRAIAISHKIYCSLPLSSHQLHLITKLFMASIEIKIHSTGIWKRATSQHMSYQTNLNNNGILRSRIECLSGVGTKMTPQCPIWLNEHKISDSQITQT